MSMACGMSSIDCIFFYQHARPRGIYHMYQAVRSSLRRTGRVLVRFARTMRITSVIFMGSGCRGPGRLKGYIRVHAAGWQQGIKLDGIKSDVILLFCIFFFLVSSHCTLLRNI